MAQAFIGMTAKLKSDDYKPGKVKIYSKSEIKRINAQRAASAATEAK